MARKRSREAATKQQELVPLRETCAFCGGTLWVAYRSVRTITTRDGLYQLLLTVRRCHNAGCAHLRLSDRSRLGERLSSQGHVVLALDGLQPDVGHEVLWVLRDCCSGEVLIARSLLGATENDLVPLLEEAASICQRVKIPITGVITDGQHSIRNAVRSALPDVPHQLCHFHSNDDQLTAVQVRQTYEMFLAEMEHTSISSETLTTMLSTFRKVTTSYWPGLFHCYDHAYLPRTNNDLEQYFGSARHHERRITGRKAASPGVVVRGAVRVVAGAATRLHHFRALDLQLTDVERWYVLRDELDTRQRSRRAQFRFRRDPSTYLADLENKLLLLRLPP